MYIFTCSFSTSIGTSIGHSQGTPYRYYSNTPAPPLSTEYPTWEGGSSCLFMHSSYYLLARSRPPFLRLELPCSCLLLPSAKPGRRKQARRGNGLRYPYIIVHIRTSYIFT